MSTQTRELSIHHLKWGLGLGVAVALCIQTLTWVGLGLTQWTFVLSLVLVIVFSVLAARSLRARSAEKPSLVQTVGLIAMMILVSRFIYQTYMFIYISYVDPNWVEMVVEVWEPQLRESGVAEERITALLADFRNQWQTWYVFTIGVVRWGIEQFVLGVIAALAATYRPWRKSTKAS